MTDNKKNWGPSASIENLKIRSRVLSKIRQFFSERFVLEVDVPNISQNTVSDPNLDSFSLRHNGSRLYLQTSPEYYLKRLLADTREDFFYLGKAFRSGEVGPLHNPEFTILEWYRCGWDEFLLMDEVLDLIKFISNEYSYSIAAHKFTYLKYFQKILKINPHTVPLAQLQETCVNIFGSEWNDTSRTCCLDLLFSQIIQPKLPSGIVFIHDFPECQSGLSEIRECSEYNVSRRFELFYNNVELGNGYFELTSGEEQRSRFLKDNIQRQGQSKDPIALDENLLSALDHGLPNCSGIAIGFDRLLMCLIGEKTISSVISFPWES
ncbi:MAG: elongation factor P lysine(34) lysyltransferase [Porticoccaceae bacterium]|nr:elongation factor P lysine(34) lysyltransferase [Porticoccaceae bacterium]|tara:strand:- start:102 stop:1067 length:966 start_codon:yes stop_codon:yes gene_type:complete